MKSVVKQELATLTEEQGRTLLRLAQAAIGSRIDEAWEGAQTAPGEEERTRGACGVFVTLRIGSRLRGCIGRIEPVTSLPVTVRECALAAAFEDPRFDALTPEEFTDLEIEISLLGPLREIRSLEEIRLGIDGLVISLGTTRGVLLPEVALEARASAGGFVALVCRKAGLPEDAWQKGARLQAFATRVFPASADEDLPDLDRA